MKQFNLWDPKHLAPMVRSWMPAVTPKATAQETHELALKAEVIEEIARRIELEYKRQSKENH